DARKYVVPGSAVMFLHGIKVPSERLRYFFFQILPGPFDVDIGNGGAHLYDGIAAGIKFGKISHTIRELSNYFAIVNNLFINPSAEINHILVKLDNEKDGIILVAILRPNVFRLLFAVPFYPAATDPGNPAIQYIVFILRRNFKVDHYARLCTLGIRIALKATARSRCQFRLYSIVSQVYFIIPHLGYLTRFINRGSISSTIFFKDGLVANFGFQFSVGGHNTQSGHGPFVNVAKGTDAFENRIIPRLPS